MKSQENIDKFFAERLQQYERQPRTVAWEKLQAKLDKQESKLIPLWWRYASAASVALLLASGIYWMNAPKDLDAIKMASNPTKTISTEKKTGEIAKDIASPIAHDNISIASNATEKSRTKIVPDISTEKAIKIGKTSAEKNLINTKDEPILVKNIAPIQIPKPEIAPSTIVLVVENTTKVNKEAEKETIVLNLIETPTEAVAETTPLDESANRKPSKFNRIWQQLKRAKNGENVDWKEVGFKPQKLLARADAKIENALTKGEETEK